MSVQITTAFVDSFRNAVMILSQQKESRLRKFVKEETAVGKRHFFEQVGQTEARKRTSRHSDTPRMDTPHARRSAAPESYDWADLIDNEDRVRTLIDPTNPYVQVAAAAMGRAMDTEIIRAATGTAQTGQTGSTAVELPSTQKIAVASSGLTIAKLLSAKEILDANEVEGPRVCCVSSAQVSDLLNTTEVKSTDFNTVHALARGELDAFLGFTFVRSERLLLTDTATRGVIAFATSAVGLVIGKDITARISERADKNYATQVFVSMDIGASRLEEEQVVEISCLES